MLSGKKSVTERIVYGAFDRIEQRTGKEGVRVFHDALENCETGIGSPLAPGRRRHLPGADRGPSDRAQTLAIRWIIGAVRNRSEHTTVDRLSNELMEASENRGSAVKRREDTHRMAEANRAFSHYRW